MANISRHNQSNATDVKSKTYKNVPLEDANVQNDLEYSSEDKQTNQTFKWPLQNLVPPFEDQRTFLTRPLTKCRLRPITWANVSSSRVHLLYGTQLDDVFNPLLKEPAQTDTAHPIRLSPFLLPSGPNSNPLSVLFAARDYECSIVFIYASWCRFSAAAAAPVNALARAYPQFKLIAVNVEDYLRHKWSLRMFFVPKLKIFVQGRIFREYNGSDTDLNSMIDFVWQTTNQLPQGPVGIEAVDYLGPLSSQSQQRTDPWLVASWLMTVIGLIYLLVVGSHRLLSLMWTCAHLLNFRANQEANSGDIMRFQENVIPVQDYARLTAAVNR